MSKNVQIIRIANGALYVFTTPWPPGASTRLMGAVVEMFSGDGYFVLQVNMSPGSPDATAAEIYAAITAQLQHTWSDLHRRGVVDTETMPEIIDGEPAMRALDRL